MNFEDFDKIENPELQKQNRKAFLKYLSKKQTKNWDLRHKQLKRNGKIFLRLTIFGNLALYGYMALYWFEYDFNIFNPKLSKYITNRLG